MFCSSAVVPAQAGTQAERAGTHSLDSGLRRNDCKGAAWMEQ